MLALALAAPYSVLGAPVALLEHLAMGLALSIRSSHGRNRWHRGYDLAAAAEILTWAARGTPLREPRRTPLWPNSDREKTSPGLISPAVRRARYTSYRRDALRIAWKWLG
jgi:hypothetical protein